MSLGGAKEVKEGRKLEDVKDMTWGIEGHEEKRRRRRRRRGRRKDITEGESLRRAEKKEVWSYAGGVVVE